MLGFAPVGLQIGLGSKCCLIERIQLTCSPTSGEKHRGDKARLGHGGGVSGVTSGTGAGGGMGLGGVVSWANSQSE